MEDRVQTVRQAGAESWLLLEVEQHGKMMTFKFPTLEFQTVSMLFNNICVRKDVTSCDFLLSNDKARLALADKNAFDDIQESQQELMRRARFTGGVG